MRRPRPEFKVSFYSYFCCFWINVQINFENIKRKIQRIISDSCFQLKSWFNVDARVPSIPLLNFSFKNTWKLIAKFFIHVNLSDIFSLAFKVIMLVNHPEYYVYSSMCIHGIYAFVPHQGYFSLFSSPEPKARVSYCRPSCVVRRASSVNFLHFHLLLENAWLDFNQTWQESSLGVGDSKLFK